MAEEAKRELSLTRVESRLCVVLVEEGTRVGLFEKEMCVALFELEPTDRLRISSDNDVDLFDSSEQGQGQVVTIGEYRDRFGQQPKAMIEQLDSDRFWFTNLTKARQFIRVHGMLEVPDSVMAHLREDAHQ
jgi:hypothetical protein